MSKVHPLIDVFVFKYALFVFVDYRQALIDVKWGHGRACYILYPIEKQKNNALVDLPFMLVWLTKFYLSFNASLIERQ